MALFSRMLLCDAFSLVVLDSSLHSWARDSGLEWGPPREAGFAGGGPGFGGAFSASMAEGFEYAFSRSGFSPG